MSKLLYVNSEMEMIVAFDIETIPDVGSGKAIYDLDGLGPEEVAKAMLATRRLKVPDATFLPLHQHRVVAISVAVLSDRGGFKTKSLGNIDSTEKQLISEFFRGIDDSKPTLVSWNGNGFDLPVLQYRALIHGVQSKTYWDTGQFDREAKWNNYHGRYHDKHFDIMDYLARYQMRGMAALDEIAKLLGLPGKVRVDQVGQENIFKAYLDGNLKSIRSYCELDALNTLLIFLRLEYIRGIFTEDKYLQVTDEIRNWLEVSDQPHMQEFLQQWKRSL